MFFDFNKSEEIFKSLDFIGFPGYKVGNFGNVWSKLRRNSDPHFMPIPWRKLSGGTTKENQHELVSLRKPDGTYEKFYIHTLVLLAFVGPCPEGMECRHFPDKNPKNNRLDNLIWGTRQENMFDRELHGDKLEGEKCSYAKLTEKDVLKIREDYSKGK